MSKVIWKGDKLTAKYVNRLTTKLRGAIQDIANKTASELPRQTGRLAESVQVKSRSTENTVNVWWGTDVEYASDVEFGTQEKAPDGTWRRVAEQEKGNIAGKLTI